MNATALFVHVPLFHDYQIERVETLRLQLPATALSSRTSFFAAPELVIYPFTGHASLGGMLSQGTTEAALRTAEHVLLITLLGNEWVPALSNATDPARLTISRDVLGGLASEVAPAEQPRGWNGLLAGLDAAACVSRLSEVVLEVRIPALAAYETAVPELVSATLPGSALVGQQPVGAGSFLVLADPGRAELTGSLVDANDEAIVKAEPSEVR